MNSKGTLFREGLTLLRKKERRNRRLMAAAATLLMAGCSGSDLPEEGTVFRGVAVADEPLAARTAADILARGGSAADAAVALYFVLSVTYPSAASLGGGGVCLVSDRSDSEVRSLSFLAPRAASSREAVRLTAVPANVRGMAALHARYGETDWRTVLAPAEQIARFGRPLTRASASSIDSAAETVLSQWEIRRIFAPTGALAGEGATIPQVDLADTIAALRVGGPGSMYSGALADTMVTATRQAGGSLAQEDLRNFLPTWRPVQGVAFGNDVAYFAPPPAGAGLLAGQMWTMLTSRSLYRDASADETDHLLIETARRAWAGRARWLADDGTTVDAASLISEAAARAALESYDPARASAYDGVEPVPQPRPGDTATTGFLVLDVFGGAVACTVTSYRPFGAGLMAPGTGVLLAPAPEPDDRNPASLGPMLIFNPRVRTFKFAAVGGTGPEAASAMMTVAAESVITTRRLDKAMRRPRTHIGNGLTAYIESSASAAAREALARRGDDVATVPSLGQVNAIFCPNGYPTEIDRILCWTETDPRGFGFVAFPN